MVPHARSASPRSLLETLTPHQDPFLGASDYPSQPGGGEYLLPYRVNSLYVRKFGMSRRMPPGLDNPKGLIII